MEEATAAKSLGVLPFKNRPLAVLEQVVDHADHFGHREFGRKHLSNRFPSFGRPSDHLVIDGVLGIEGRHRIGICRVEGCNPAQHQFTWFHAPRVTRRPSK